MIQFKAGLEWLWIRIRAYVFTSETGNILCIVSSGYFIGCYLAGVVSHDADFNDLLTAVAFFIAGGWTRICIRQDRTIAIQRDTIDLQRAIIESLGKALHTRGESEDVDLGQGSGPPGSVPSP